MQQATTDPVSACESVFVPLEAATLQLRFAPLRSSLHLVSTYSVRHAAEVEVRLSCPDGSTETSSAHLGARVSATLSLPLRCMGAAEGALTVEVSDPCGGGVLALGAVPGGALNSSVGTLRIALLCPDALRAVGTLQLTYIRADDKLVFTSPTPPSAPAKRARVVPAGLLASGEFARVPSVICLGGVSVSRTALHQAPPASPFSVAAPPLESSVCLELSVGDATLPGGAADVNALVAAACTALDAPEVAALCTSDLKIAAVLKARAPDAPLVWCGQPTVAKRFRIASIHPEGPSVVHAPRDGVYIVLPDELYALSLAQPRRRRSVVWADPLVPQPAAGTA